MTYLEGNLELMNPFRSHETLKSRIGRLIEVYCEAEGIEFDTVGSWTLIDKDLEGGVEPDECYIFGELDRDRPHLAIEVVWTPAGSTSSKSTGSFAFPRCGTGSAERSR